MTLVLVIEIDREEDGRYTAECPTYQGHYIAGPSREAVIRGEVARLLRLVAAGVDAGEYQDLREIRFEVTER